jgi:hypothetical protein
MGPEDVSQNGKRKVRELCGPYGARRSIALTSRAVSFGIWRNPGYRPKNGCYEPEYTRSGREPGPPGYGSALTWGIMPDLAV